VRKNEGPESGAHVSKGLVFAALGKVKLWLMKTAGIRRACL